MYSFSSKRNELQSLNICRTYFHSNVPKIFNMSLIFSSLHVINVYQVRRYFIKILKRCNHLNKQEGVNYLPDAESMLIIPR